MYKSGVSDQSSTPSQLPLHDSWCVICGAKMKQLVADDPENRGICYECHDLMWGKNTRELVGRTGRAKALAAAA